MASPIPDTPLDDSCSVIHNGTLYVYTPDSFQSLPLKNGSEWSTLPKGAAASGAECIKGDVSGAGSGEALWVVGGSSSDQGYTGLQRFSFQNQSWTTITPVVNVTRNRRGHAVTFLTKTSQILMYAGSATDPDQPSIETFLVSTVQPYGILSFTGKNLPVVRPILLPWSDSAAISVGGNANNTVISFFTAGGGWIDYPTALQSGLKDRRAQRAALVTGSDGSKVMEVFDLSVSPNTVSRVVLQNAEGQPAKTGTTIGQAVAPQKSSSQSSSAPQPSGSSRNQRSKRDLSLADWPAYNATVAPNYTRQGFSIAQSQLGLVAIAGGNDEHPVALFNQQTNTWVDSGKFFGLNNDVHQSILRPSSTMSSASHTSTSTPTPSQTEAAAPTHHTPTSTILAAVLSSIIGFVVLLIIVLLLLRWRRLKKDKRAQSYVEKEKRMSFADRGNPMMMENTMSDKLNTNHTPGAVIPGNVGGNGSPYGPPGHKRGGGLNGSDASTARLVPKDTPYGYRGDTLELQALPDSANAARFGGGLTPNNGGLKPPMPKRSSGWSRYFSGSEMLAAGVRKSGLSGKSRDSGRASSTYSSQHPEGHAPRGTSPIPRGTSPLPPLNFGNDFESELNANHPQDRGIYDQTRPGTGNSQMSSAPSTIHESLFSREPQQNSTWTPVTNSSDFMGRRDTAVSSVYSDGMIKDGGVKAPGMFQNSQYTSGAVDPSYPMPADAAARATRGTNLDALARPPPVHTNGGRPGTSGSEKGTFLKPASPLSSSNGTSSQVKAFPAPGSGPAQAVDNVYVAPGSVSARGTNNAFSASGSGPAQAPSNAFSTPGSGATQPTRNVSPVPGSAPTQSTNPAYRRPVNGQANGPPNGRPNVQPKPSVTVTNHDDGNSEYAMAWPHSQDALLHRLPAGADGIPQPGVRSASPLGKPMRPQNNHDSMASDITVWPGGNSQAKAGQKGGLAPVNQPKALGSHDSLASDVTVWPRPPQMQGQRASIVEEDDDEYDDEPAEIITATGRNPTAVTAIPVPASTAMQYTVKKSVKPTAGPTATANENMNWFNMNQTSTR